MRSEELEHREDSKHLGIVRDVSKDVGDAPPDIMEFFLGLNACARRIHESKKRLIDANCDPEMPKVVWKLLSISQGIIYRAVELHNAVAILINGGNLLGALIMTRTLVELMAFASEINDGVAKGVVGGDLGQIDAAIMSGSFATRWEDMPEETKAKNILTILERFDRNFMADPQSKPVSGMHATLSEFTHPNWNGMMGFFGSIDQDSRIQWLSVQHRDRDGLYVQIAAGCVCLFAIEKILVELDGVVPKVWELSEAVRLGMSGSPRSGNPGTTS